MKGNVGGAERAPTAAASGQLSGLLGRPPPSSHVPPPVPLLVGAPGLHPEAGLSCPRLHVASLGREATPATGPPARRAQCLLGIPTGGVRTSLLTTSQAGPPAPPRHTPTGSPCCRWPLHPAGDSGRVLKPLLTPPLLPPPHPARWGARKPALSLPAAHCLGFRHHLPPSKSRAHVQNFV